MRLIARTNETHILIDNRRGGIEMDVVFGREFTLELRLSEGKLHDLLLELSQLRRMDGFEDLENLELEIRKAIDANKGYTLIETE